jgi:hypothetical protein
VRGAVPLTREEEIAVLAAGLRLDHPDGMGPKRIKEDSEVPGVERRLEHPNGMGLERIKKDSTVLEVEVGMKRIKREGEESR